MTTLNVSDLIHIEPSAAAKEINHEWKKIRQLWNDLEKKQARNERYEKRISDFFDEFKRQALESEQLICKATADFARHLLTFVARKSIKGSQREALYEWIEEEVSILEANPFSQIDTAELRNAFTEALVEAAPKNPAIVDISDHEIELLRDEVETMLGDELPLTNEDLLEMVKDPRKFQIFFEQMMAEQQEQEFAGEFDDEDEHEFNYNFHQQQHIEHSAKSLAFFQAKEMTKLYRQLAKQLHPDKEPDPEQKEYKKTLMQQLSMAKKEKDAIAMILLAQQHLPEFELNLDKEAILGLEATLNDKIRQLNFEHRDLQHGHDLKTQVWKKFGGGNKKAQLKSIEAYIKGLQNEAKQLEQDKIRFRTVQAIKESLRERSMMMNMPNFLDFDF